VRTALSEDESRDPGSAGAYLRLTVAAGATLKLAGCCSLSEAVYRTPVFVPDSQHATFVNCFQRSRAGVDFRRACNTTS
jgi:hypothetical protein